jgi:very-short-patch-repair endonuclease
VDGEIADLAEMQHGVVALRQLTAFGLAESTVRSRVDRGRLHRVHRGVYSVGHRLLTVRGRLMAGVLACGPDAVLSHRSAARLWGIRQDNRSKVDVSVPRWGSRSRPGITVHVSRRIQRTIVDGIPCTTLAGTLLDLAEVVPRNQVENAITRAEQLRIFDLSAVEQTLATSPGRRGAPVLDSVIAKYRHQPTKSELERLFLKICFTHDIQRPSVNHKVNGFEVDFHWPHHRLIVETDGWETHGTRAAFEEDRRRDQVHQAAGWRVVRFTWRQVVDEPDYVGRYTSSIVNASSPTSRNFV